MYDTVFQHLVLSPYALTYEFTYCTNGFYTMKKQPQTYNGHFSNMTVLYPLVSIVQVITETSTG